MKKILHLKKNQQQLMPLFNDACLENKPIPFPDRKGTIAYSSLFYWAYLESFESAAFPLHPHEGFEIMTFVLEGNIEHYDTATKIWTPLQKGDVQVIHAGSGVQHSEKINKGAEAFQIWFDPDFSKTINKDAKYKDYPASSFKTEKIKGIDRLVYLGDKGIISCDTPNIKIEKLSFTSGVFEEELDDKYTYSCYLINGEIQIDDVNLEKDDFIKLSSSSNITFTVNNNAELFVIKSSTTIDYPLFRDKY